MQRDLVRLADTAFDLLVVGGGIYGLICAYDAAQRGLRVALVERDDLFGGSSSNHLKTAHGGLRALQTGDLRHARASIVERRTFARIAPVAVRPLSFLLPTSRAPSRHRLALAAAFHLDALIGCDRNDGIAPHLRLARGRLVGVGDCRRMAPPLGDAPLTGGALWQDYQFEHAERLTTAFAAAAAAHGATLANYVEATGLAREADGCVRVTARDGIAGAAFDVRARLVLNATGAGAERLLRAFGIPCDLPVQKAANLILSRPVVDPALKGRATEMPAAEVAIGATAAAGGALFLVPWRDVTMLGTWHADVPYAPTDAADPRLSEQEMATILDTANRAFPALGLRRSDVRMAHSGLVPARRAGPGVVMRGRPLLIDHARDGVPELLSVVGVKYTTARLVAEKAVDAVCARLARRVGSATATTPLNVRLVQDPVDDETLRREAVLAVHEEMAQSLVDVVVRRTAWGAAGHPGAELAGRIALAIAAPLGWSAVRVAREVDVLKRYYAS